MNLFKRDAEIVSCALTMWANYIETGHVTLSSQDAQNCGYKDEIRTLDDNQMRFVLRLRKMSTKKWEQESSTRKETTS
jgi:hypothetical protein